ncbi:hypothetical protein LMH87_001546 [Akanthomyces muscarius]|uniref:Uncharacterized protein n=1 Tax=Akanthomyces muscarius TaxID=2231603 RepID=A0A9W8UIR6_AKAMU|nr:hypothetical protein LMH87_001546 [Akanthomyces muscarius]KAJ4146993.1 hypothetical protein LMH87_001546 [Akanthomyces muscarius]
MHSPRKGSNRVTYGVVLALFSKERDVLKAPHQEQEKRLSAEQPTKQGQHRQVDHDAAQVDIARYAPSSPKAKKNRL